MQAPALYTLGLKTRVAVWGHKAKLEPRSLLFWIGRLQIRSLDWPADMWGCSPGCESNDGPTAVSGVVTYLLDPRTEHSPSLETGSWSKDTAWEQVPLSIESLLLWLQTDSKSRAYHYVQAGFWALQEQRPGLTHRWPPLATTLNIQDVQ